MALLLLKPSAMVGFASLLAFLVSLTTWSVGVTVYWTRVKSFIQPKSNMATHLLDDFLREKEIQGLSRSTLKAYRYDIERFSLWVFHHTGKRVRWRDLSPDLVSKFLKPAKTPATRARYLASLKAFSAWAMRRRLIQEDLLAPMRAPRVRSAPARHLSTWEFRKLLQAVAKDGASRSLWPTRDFAILVLFLGLGLRLSELVGLRLTDFNPSEMAITVRRKGGNVTTLPLGQEVCEALNAWLRKRATLPLPDQMEIIFISNRLQAMNKESIRLLVKRWCLRAGVPIMNPHALRHTYASEQLRLGTSLAVVRDLLGHANVATTSRYLHSLDSERREAAERINFTEKEQKR